MLAILIICLVIFGAISLPIGIAMGLATMLCLVFATNIDPIMVAQNAFAGIDSFSLMAIPFFMLAGNFMRYGGISKRLLDLADTSSASSPAVWAPSPPLPPCSTPPSPAPAPPPCLPSAPS